MSDSLLHEEFITNGISIYPERRLEAFFRPVLSSRKNIKNKDRYLVIYIQEGDGVLRGGGNDLSYQGPCVMLVDHRLEDIEWIQGCRNRGFLFYFHPLLVNSRIHFEDLHRMNNPNFSTSDWRDIFLLESFATLKAQSIDLYPLDPILDDKMKTLGDRIESVLVRQEVEKWPCFTRSYLFELLLTLQMVRENTGEPDLKVIPDRLKEVQIYIQSNYNRPLTLEGIAEKFHTNKTTLTQLFRDYFQMPVKQYILQYRMEVAKSLLEKTALSVQEISFRVGFPDPSHFNRRFKNQLACTPGQYRKKHRPW